MNVLFIESQKKGKIKTCLHVHFPASLASHPLTWCNDKEIILATLAIGGVDWGRRGGQRLSGEQSVGGERGLADSELLFLPWAPLLHRVHAPKWSGTGPFHRLHPLRWADSPSVFYKLLCKHSFKAEVLANSLPSPFPKKTLYLSFSDREIIEPPCRTSAGPSHSGTWTSWVVVVKWEISDCPGKARCWPPSRWHQRGSKHPDTVLGEPELPLMWFFFATWALGLRGLHSR